MIVSSNVSMPSPVRATVDTIGMPIMPPNFSWLSVAPLASSSSYMLSAMTVGWLRSISSVVR